MKFFNVYTDMTFFIAAGRILVHHLKPAKTQMSNRGKHAEAEGKMTFFDNNR